jgi:hypothetical protein
VGDRIWSETEFVFGNDPEVENICQEAAEMGDWDTVHLASKTWMPLSLGNSV